MALFCLSCGIFLYFLKTVWFLLKIYTYILDNTLVVLRLKIFMGVFYGAPLLGANSEFSFWGEGTFLVFFSIS